MAEVDSFPINSGDSAEEPESQYLDKTIELLRRVRELWVSPASISEDDDEDETESEEDNSKNDDEDETENEEEDKSRKVDEDRLSSKIEIPLPFDLYISSELSDYSFEPSVRRVIEQHDNKENLVSFLCGIPMWVFGQVACELGCFEVNSARTNEEQVRVFLKKFGYIDVEDRKPPEGILAAQKFAEIAASKLAECTENDIGSVIGQGTAIGIAMESILRVLVLFYGQFVLPDIFSKFLKDQKKYKKNDGNSRDWWRSCLPYLEQVLVNQRDVRQFLIEEKTQMDLSIRILRPLNDYIPTDSDLAKKFSSTFERETIFPPLDTAKVSRRRKGEHKEFLAQLEEIKNLRNEIDHAERDLQEGRFIPDPAKVMRQVTDLSSAAAFFFEAGKAHRLFPEAILITTREQRIRRHWLIHAKDERNNPVSFRVGSTLKDTYLPDCEFFCWPPESIQSGPKVTLIKLWRA